MPKKTVKVSKTVKKNKSAKTTKKPVKKATKATKKVVPVVATPVVAPVAAPVVTESDLIWQEIMNLPIEMFALPNQVVSQHCNKITIEPSKLYLLVRSSATLPSLEAALGRRFVVSLLDKYVVVERAPKPLGK